MKATLRAIRAHNIAVAPSLPVKLFPFWTKEIALFADAELAEDMIQHLISRGGSYDVAEQVC